MTTPAASAGWRCGRIPGRLVAIAVILLLGLTSALAMNVWVGLAILALGLVLVAWPLEPFVGLLLVAGAAAFVRYGELHVQRDLAVVLVLTSYALLAVAVAGATGRWHLPWSRLSAALLALAITTGVAVLHGLAVGNALRFMGLEVFSLFTLAFALAVGGLRLRSSNLRIAGWALAAVGIASSSVGFYVLATTGRRTQGMPFSPVPGLVALVLLGLMLFDPARRPRLGMVLLFCVLVFHQVITFTRGYWLGLLVSVPFVCAVYVSHHRGSRQSWTKVLTTLGFIGVVLIVGVTLASSWLGLSEVIGMLGGRFASSFETRNTPETISNIVRLLELRVSLNHILASPWLGEGHGSTLIVRQFFYSQTRPQWFVHESYVLILLKQGVAGLLALLWVLWVALRLGLKGTSHPDPRVAGWCAAAAAGTVFNVIIGLTNYNFFTVTQNFMLAFLWGISLAASEPRCLRLAWRVSAPATSPGDGAAS